MAHGAVSEYDDLTKLALIAGITDKEGRFYQLLDDKWILSKETSAFGDGNTLFLVLDAHANKGIMSLRCMEKETKFILNLNEYMGSEPMRLEYKIDDTPITEVEANPSKDGQLVFMPNSIEFIKSLFGKKKLAIRVAPYNKSKTERVYDISGIENVIEPLAQECGWSVKAQ